MPVKYAKAFAPGKTPQSEPISTDQVKNYAGGYVYQISDWAKLDRFIVLGTEGGTYYANETKLTREAAKTILGLIKTDGPKVVARVVELSTAGRAYKNDAALFVLALAISEGDAATKGAVQAALTDVARIGTHLFTFVEYAKSMRGWGRALKSAVRGWYEAKPAEKLARQVTKYAQRNGWSHRDLLRLTHPKAENGDKDFVYKYAVGKFGGLDGDFPTTPTGIYLATVEKVKVVPTRELPGWIKQLDLPREVLPTEALTDKGVWAALFEKMPMTAMIRNTATMTRVGLIEPLSKAAGEFATRVTDRERLKSARIHPVQVLAAQVTYASGKGARGSNTWTPVQSVADALDKAFYLAFDAVEPTGKRIMLAVDVSGSMNSGTICGVPNLTPRHGAAAMSLVIANTEPNNAIYGFTAGRGRGGYSYSRSNPDGFIPLAISPRQRLDDVMRYMSGLDFGGTDCSLPIRHALDKGLVLDAFIVLTDNETWAGNQHPVEALREYRKKYNPNAKLIVVGMTATGFSIADPNDPGMLDVVGFSTDTPSVISDFIRG